MLASCISLPVPMTGWVAVRPMFSNARATPEGSPLAEEIRRLSALMITDMEAPTKRPVAHA